MEIWVELSEFWRKFSCALLITWELRGFASVGTSQVEEQLG
jgi:hypothetical protein